MNGRHGFPRARGGGKNQYDEDPYGTSGTFYWEDDYDYGDVIGEVTTNETQD